MSMLTAQAEGLRETADEVERIKHNNADWLWRDAITLDDAVKEMRDAADTIENLRDRLTEPWTCRIDFIDTFERYDGDEEYLCECSVCGGKSWEPAHDLPQYCRKCGAKVVI